MPGAQHSFFRRRALSPRFARTLTVSPRQGYIRQSRLTKAAIFRVNYHISTYCVVQAQFTFASMAGVLMSVHQQVGLCVILRSSTWTPDCGVLFLRPLVLAVTWSCCSPVKYRITDFSRRRHTVLSVYGLSDFCSQFALGIRSLFLRPIVLASQVPLGGVSSDARRA